MSDEPLRQHPAWREGVKRFLAAGFAAGQTIDHSWFFNAFDIEEPGDNTPFAEAEKAKLAYLGAIEKLKYELLEAHQIGLASVPGRGYRWVPPAEQTAWAEKEFMADLRNQMGKAATRMTGVNLAELSAEQRADNADALARLSFLAGAVKQVKTQGSLAGLPKPE